MKKFLLLLLAPALMASQVDTGGSVAGKANVTSTFELQVALPNTAAQVGSVRGKVEVDSGTLNAAGVLLRSPLVSPLRRLTVGTDTALFTDHFNGTAQNTNLWSYTLATMTATLPGTGYLQLSTVQGTTSAHGLFLRSYQYFPLTDVSPTSLEFKAGQFTAVLATDENVLMGFGLPSAAVTRPTDGLWWKITSAGVEGITSFAGTELSTGVIFAFGSLTLGTQQKYRIVVGKGEIEWWINDILLKVTAVTTSQGMPTIQGSQPIFIQKFNSANVANTNTWRISHVDVHAMDVATGKPAETIASTQGNHVGVVQNGTAASGSASVGFTNAAITATAAIANATAAAQFIGLGGYFTATAQATNVAAAGDMIAQTFFNPTPTNNITGRNLIITGVHIEAMNTGAVIATTPTTLVWGIAWGHLVHTTLAGTETASFATGTTHVPRRQPLGFMTAPTGAIIGAPYDKVIDRAFTTPIVVRPGESLTTTLRFRLGTATASQEVTYIISFDGYWE